MHSPVNVVGVFFLLLTPMCSVHGWAETATGEGKEKEKENMQVCYMFHPLASVHRGTLSRDWSGDGENRVKEVI